MCENGKQIHGMEEADAAAVLRAAGGLEREDAAGVSGHDRVDQRPRRAGVGVASAHRFNECRDDIIVVFAPFVIISERILKCSFYFIIRNNAFASSNSLDDKL